MQHHRVQQFIIDSLTKEAVHLTHEELAEISGSDRSPRPGGKENHRDGGEVQGGMWIFRAAFPAELLDCGREEA